MAWTQVNVADRDENANARVIASGSGIYRALKLSLWVGLAAALLFFALAPAYALDIPFRSQTISVQGLQAGDYFYLNGEPNFGTEELVLVFTNANPSVIKTFTAPYDIEARMLVVGGGGAGGLGSTTTTNPGGGGGGGGVTR